MFQDMVVTFDASKKDEGKSDELYDGLANKGRFANLDDFYHPPREDEDNILEEIDPEHPHQRKSKDEGSIVPGLLTTAAILAAVGGGAYWYFKKRRQSSTFDSRAYSGLGIN